MGLVEVSSAIEIVRVSNLTLTTQESFVVLEFVQISLILLNFKHSEVSFIVLVFF